MISSAGDSRTSSVFGLKASPQTAIVFPSQLPVEYRFQLPDDAHPLILVHFYDRAQQFEFVIDVTRDLDQRSRVLREARTAIANPGFKKRWADPFIVPHAFRHTGDVGTDLLANVRDFVDERYFRRQKSIGGVF